MKSIRLPAQQVAAFQSQVAKVRRLVEELGYQVATPDEVREMLSLKGIDKVNFWNGRSGFTDRFARQA